MIITVLRIALPLISGVFLCTGLVVFFMYDQTIETELRRKRNADAYEIRDALAIYMHENNGALPSSLAELKFESEGADPLPFILYAPGTRKGMLDQYVMVEAEEGGNGKYRIVIYADGTVRWD